MVWHRSAALEMPKKNEGLGIEEMRSRTHGIRIPARDAHVSHKVKVPRANHPGAFTFLARPTGFEPVAFGFVEDIHVWSNTCKDVQACANTGSVSDEKSKNAQIHASLSKNLAGSLLNTSPPESEVSPRMLPLLSVRQVAALLGVCAATVYRMCEQGEIPHFRVRNAIRVPMVALKACLETARR
jgi:excisionase family DNA binding protein